jgi:hypothetical protein
MKKSLYDQINQALDDRKDWATRQERNYKMRNGGIRRMVKPFPLAADGHYPLGDTLTEKLKPLYVQQLYGSETVCSFVCLKPQDDELTQSVGHWFDYILKQKSNFERSMFVAIDQMIEQGFTPIKVYWNAGTKRLCWEQIDPLHLIVPNACQEYNQNGGTDWMVHVLHMSVAEYEANGKFEQGEEFVKRIKGKGNKSDSDANSKQQTVDYKEGINCSDDDNEIVLWEVYNRDRKSGKITVETISPLLSCDEGENVVRQSFTLPYNQGCFASGEHFPFFQLRYEIKGKGHYSGRGVMEIAAPFEMSLTASWNSIHDHMAFSSKPLFENSGASPLPNAGNWKSKPGAIMPPGLKLAQMPEPPTSLRQDMDLTRALAEDRVQIPNFSASEHLTGQVPSSQTATGQKLIAAQSSQGNDLRARVFKLDLAEGLQLGWSLLLQYGNVDESLTYLVNGKPETLNPASLHKDYEIVPNGSADSWNKGAVVQKRLAYYQTFLENPYVDQAESTKWLMEGDDPKMVKRLFKDPQIQAAEQSEDQAIENLILDDEFSPPPKVERSDDHKTHLMILDQSSQAKIQAGLMTPVMAGRRLQHGIEHMAGLKENKDPLLKQVEATLKPTAELLAFISTQPGPREQNIISMQQPAGINPGATQDSPSSPTGPAGAASPDQMSVTNQ